MVNFEIMKKRHSVRQYTEKRIEPEKRRILDEMAWDINLRTALHIQLIYDEPKAFSTAVARYGSFKNVRNYIALVGKRGEAIDEACGYWGEKLVLKAQEMGLNTCWVGLTYSRNNAACHIEADERLRLVIALGYGAVQGVPHKTKTADRLAAIEGISGLGSAPAWFRKGMEAAQLAPTAINQQKFKFVLNEDGTVSAKAGLGFYTRVDLGIAKYHFEQGAGEGSFSWA